MNPVEQTLLYATSIVVLAGTLTVFVVQYVRMRRRDRGDDGRGGGDAGRGPGDGGRGPGDGGAL